jgi:hypothetical protein
MKRSVSNRGLNQTAVLLLIAYLDVAILGGVAAAAHWYGYRDRPHKLEASSLESAVSRHDSPNFSGSRETTDDEPDCASSSD